MPYENLNNIDDYQLISFVESKPELWQMNHAQYGNSSLKNKHWAFIGSLLGFDGTLCKNRWVNIRDNYRRSLKKSISDPGHKTYKFYDQLNFLKPYIMLDAQKGSLSMILNHDSSNDSPLSPSTTNTLQVENSPRTCVHIKSSVSKKRTRPSSTEGTPEKILRKYESKIRGDAVDAFLAGLAPTLKSLTPYYLNLAKSKIFMTVQKYEMQMLMEAQQEEISEEIHYEDPYRDAIFSENQDSDTELIENPVDIKQNIQKTADGIIFAELQS